MHKRHTLYLLWVRVVNACLPCAPPVHAGEVVNSEQLEWSTIANYHNYYSNYIILHDCELLHAYVHAV